MTRRPFLLPLAIILATCGCSRSVEKQTIEASPPPPPSSSLQRYYVSATGSDEAAGTQEAPFATLERARDRIRELRHTGKLATEGAEIVLVGDISLRKEPLTLTSKDSGTEQAPLRIMSAPGKQARLSGGISVPLADFTPVTKPETLARIPENARGHVLEIDLRARGISQFEPLPLFGHSMSFLQQQTQYRIGRQASEIFLGGTPLQIARWPNTDYTKTGKVSDKGDIIRSWMEDQKGAKHADSPYVPPAERPATPRGFTFEFDPAKVAQWSTAPDAMMHGYWYHNWSDQAVQVESFDTKTNTIRSVQPSGYGIKEGQRFYIYNLIEELDTPGEWYLDREHGILYLYPPASTSADASVDISLTSNPLLLTQNAAHIRIEGLEFSTGRSNAISINNGENIQIQNCTITNFGGSGISINGGQNHIVNQSVITNTGIGGISAKGGDTGTLQPGGHLISNSTIRNYARIEKTYRPAISLTGVGNSAIGNDISDGTHVGIIFSGNNHLIERNYIHDVCQESDDASAIYAGRSWTSRGTVIRYNLMRDITGFKQGTHRVSGIYLDDGFSGTTVEGNIFINVAQGLMFNGGRDNSAINNIFIDVENMMRATDMREAYTTWAAPAWKTLNDDLAKAPLNQPAWAAAYPELLTLKDDSPAIPKGDAIYDNLLFQTPIIMGKKGIHDAVVEYGDVDDNITIDTPPGHFDPATNRFVPNADSGLFNLIPELKEIPFANIGPDQPEGR
ncbi:right-handed parallel beta-helix repeat-containing protein [Ruficoccus amylovorans]|uniref:Right-handed parallel beta-helix repeat-containing protein n=1 Tax=Ruficoccus amylovorans TaxID=1804625 RepID=A0A842HDX4_9BACT|nr:right-handed parallel beta-helix repeat-containing protein [Ruficoccus amylovorans]MBC2594420.1 right-handed parallel beta-helix repeat-containing protein [Ruficoccus amylovorans]